MLFSFSTFSLYLHLSCFQNKKVRKFNYPDIHTQLQRHTTSIYIHIYNHVLIHILHTNQKYFIYPLFHIKFWPEIFNFDSDNMAFNPSRFTLVLFVGFAFLSLDVGLAARHLLQTTGPNLPPLPTIPSLPQPNLPRGPTLPQPTLPIGPTFPNLGMGLPPLPVVTSLPNIPFPTIPTNLPFIPFFSPPPSTTSP